MASTNKTSKLKLNKWLGTDKIQRADFNNDNDNVEKEFSDRGTSVLWYGADPTGVNDSTVAIQNCISENAVVYFPKGTYKITGAINLGFDRLLIGQGNRRSKINCVGASAGFILPTVRRIVFDGLYITSDDKSANYGILVQSNTYDCTFKHLQISNFKLAGMRFENDCWVHRFDDILIEGCLGDGFQAGGAFNNTTFTHVRSVGNTGHGFLFLGTYASHGISFFGCRAERNTLDGWHLYGTSGGQFEFSGCYIEANRKGLALGWTVTTNSIDNVNINGCTFYDNNECSIDAYMVKNVVITNARFSGTVTGHTIGALRLNPRDISDHSGKQASITQCYFADVIVNKIVSPQFCTIIENLNNELLIKSFGAKGDGIVDDSDAFINAHNSLPTSGGIINLGDGKFRITRNITFTKPVILKGKGYTTNYLSSNQSPSVIIKDGNFTGIIISGNGSKIENLQIDGAIGNGGIGLQIKAGRVSINHIAVTNQGGDGVRIGDTVKTNTNLWRINNLVVLKNGGRGLHISDDGGGGSPDANAGVLVGLDARENTSDGLYINNAIDNTFIAPSCQYNAKGIHLGSSAKGNQFYGSYTEFNTIYDFILEASSTKNFIFGYRCGVTDDPIVDNGTNNFYIGSEDNIPIFRKLFDVAVMRYHNTAAGGGKWLFKQDIDKGLLVQVVETSTDPIDMKFEHANGGKIRHKFHQISIDGGTLIKGHYSQGATLDFPSIPANSTSELTITVAGASVGDTVYANPNTSIENGLVWSAYVSAVDTVKVRLANITTSAIDPTSKAWRVDVWKH